MEDRYTCSICGKNIYSKFLRKHIEKEHNLDFIEYLRENLGKGGYCKECGKPTNPKHALLREGFLDFCSLDCVYKNKELKDKFKQTMLEKYGVENPSQLPEIKEKKKQTCMDHYGVDHNFKIKEVITKRKEVNNAKSFQEKIRCAKRINCIILESMEEWFNNEKGEHKFHCKVHDLDFKSHWYPDRNLCPKCRRKTWSREEYELGLWIESLGIPIIRNDRIQIKPKEIDIWIPSRNIGIEYNGSYWHQDQSRDQEKKLLCDSKGINLIYIWDYQWNDDKEEVKESLRKILQ